MARHSDDGFEVQRIPVERLGTIELVPALSRRNPIHAFVEVDVTLARRLLRQHRERTGEPRSFTAFVIRCLATAVDEQRPIQAFRRGRRLYVARTVDVATLIEVEADGQPVPLPSLIRDAARLSYEDIHERIRLHRRDGMLTHRYRRQSRWIRRLPRPVRWAAFRTLARMTRTRVRLGGTVLVTSVGSAGGGRGWGVGTLVGHPVTLTVGGVHRAPIMNNGGLEERDWLCLTITLDHEVVDGAPAARFVRRLVQLLEHAHGLDHLEAHDAVAAG